MTLNKKFEKANKTSESKPFPRFTTEDFVKARLQFDGMLVLKGMQAMRKREMEGKLKLKSDSTSLGIKTREWKKALKNAAPDAAVGIRHAAIKGDASLRFHVAAIPKQVGCHVHFHEDEAYSVVAGSGRLHWGKVTMIDGHPFTAWEEPVDVKQGQSFTIPEGYAHQLEKRGDNDLVILFSCPDSHLNNDADRTMLPNAPTLGKNLRPKAVPPPRP